MLNELIPIFAALIGFVVTLGIGFLVVPFLRRLKFGQTILDIGPNWHKSKQGTPTMGGFQFIIGTVAAVLLTVVIASIMGGTRLMEELANDVRLIRLVAGMLMALCMAFIGFIDDYIKVVKKRNLGLSAYQKTTFQLLTAGAYLYSLLLSGMHTVQLPFLGEINIRSGPGLLFWPIALCFIYGFTNAVNLTDGLDGLASSVTLVVAMFFMLCSGWLAYRGQLPYVTLNVAAAALAGACGGFLFWNLHPAKVFMGDTGSMFLGGMVVALSFMLDRPVVLLLVGVIYLIEALSVVLQVTVYKLTKKRIFKMSPLHHHFEMCGLSENIIVILFSAVTLAACVGAFFLVMSDIVF